MPPVDDGPADLPKPTPLPPVTDSPLGMLADAALAPASRPVKKVVKKVVKKAVKRSGAPPQATGARPTATVASGPRPTGQIPAVKATKATKAVPASKPARAKGKSRDSATGASATGAGAAGAAGVQVAHSPAGSTRPERPDRQIRPDRPSKATRAVDPVDALLDDRPAPPPTRTLGKDAQASIKGLVIIGIAAAAGLALLSGAYNRDGQLVAGRPVASVEATTTTGSPFFNTTTSVAAPVSTAPLKKPADLTVQVANAANLPGTPAGDTTKKVSGLGYKVQSAADAPADQQVKDSQVWYAEGLKGEAEELAKALKIPADKVKELPKSVPGFVGKAQLVVMLGPGFVSSPS